MIKYLFLTCLIAGSSVCFSQDVKVKKGDVLVGGTIVGKLEKEGSIFKGRTYTLKSLDGSIILIGRPASVYSVLEKRDLPLHYNIVEFPTKNAKLGLEAEEIKAYGIDDYFVKFFVENKIFENGKLNEVAAAEFIKAHPDTIPSKITSLLNKEQEYLADMATIAERDKKKELEIFLLKPDVRTFYETSYNSENYQILQDKVLIGYASILKPQMPSQFDNSKVVFYNINKTPIARLSLSQTGNLRIYGKGEDVPFTEHKLNSTVSAGNRYKVGEIARFLISKEAI